MKGFIKDIENLTEENPNFRHVMYTGKNLQLVLMTLLPKEEIGEEIHKNRDQFFRIESGKGKIIIDGITSEVKSNFGIFVPAGVKHNLINTGSKPLHLYTLYGPPEHCDQIIQKTKIDAEKNEMSFDGKTTESVVQPYSTLTSEGKSKSSRKNAESSERPETPAFE